MQRPKSMSEHQRHDQDARPEDNHVLGLAQIEAADSTDEQVGYDKIEEAPQDIDQSRRTSRLPGGDAKGLWKACPETPLPRWGKVFARNAPPKKYAK